MSEGKKLKIQDKERNKESVEAFLKGNEKDNPSSPVEVNAYERYLDLKEKLELIEQSASVIKGDISKLTEFISQEDSIETLYKEMLLTLNAEIADINKFREELVETVSLASEKIDDRFNRTHEAILAKNKLNLDKAEEAFNKNTQKASENFETALKELEDAKVDLQKHAARFANPSKYISKGDVALMFGTLILGSFLTWLVMNAFAGKVIENHFQSAVEQAVIEHIENMEEKN